MYYGKSDVPYLSVDQVAQILRVSRWTLYRNMIDIPHIMVGPEYRIKCEFVFLEPPVIRVGGKDYHPEPYQEMLDLDFRPLRTWRNTGLPVVLDPYGTPLPPSTH